MRYEILETKPYLLGIDLERPFPLGFGALEKLPRVLFIIKALDESGMMEGIGEASIDFPFSTYDAWDIYWALSRLEIEGRNVEERESILTDKALRRALLERFPAAFTALNMALDDLYGQMDEKSILEMYGQKRLGGQALASISFQSETALLIAEVEGKFQHGFIPKPKVGKTKEEDTATIKAVALLSCEKQIPFVLDFNARYEPEEFKELVLILKKMGVNLSSLLFMEQPTKEESNIEGLVFAKEALRQYGYETPVMADESFVTLKNAVECTKANLSLNFKIHKVGGLYHAQEIEKAILPMTQEKTKNMVGGTFPTAIGRAYDQQAAATLATTTLPGDGWEPSTDWFRDEKHLIKEKFLFDPQTKNFLPIRGKGLGIRPDWKKIEKFTIRNPQEEYRRIRLGKDGKFLKIHLKPNENYPASYLRRTGRKPDWNL
ncbi:MAG: enolase C-terminal domain-like protein [Patescibacteria group bacterium]